MIRKEEERRENRVEEQRRKEKVGVEKLKGVEDNCIF